jgi:hypothetical protein
VAVKRLYVADPAGSPNCPSNLPGGCWNTGAYDPARSPMCYDPQQFASFADMAAYAAARGQILESTTAAGAGALCSIQTVATGGSADPPAGGCNNCGGSTSTSTTAITGTAGSTGGGWGGGVAGGRNPFPVSTTNNGAGANAGTAGKTTAGDASGFPWWLVAVAAAVFFVGGK